MFEKVHTQVLAILTSRERSECGNTVVVFGIFTKKCTIFITSILKIKAIKVNEPYRVCGISHYRIPGHDLNA